MAGFFDKIKTDIENGWDKFKDALEDTAREMGEEQKEEIEEASALYSWADGDVLSYPYDTTNASEKDKMMRSLAVMMMKDNELVSPANGVVASIREEDNTIAIALNKEVIVAVKVCNSCADFTKDADILVKVGDTVKKGQPLVKLNQVLEAKTKLLLVTPESTQAFLDLGFKPVQPAGITKKASKIISK